MLLVDNREHALIKLFQQAQDLPYVLKIKPLDVGDVWICREEDAPEYVIERKTVADLDSSYKDGRYKDQKMRLINCTAPMVVLMVEGYSGDRCKDAVGKKRLLSTFTHCLFRDSISVYHTTCLQDSYEWIDWTAREFCKGKLKHEEGHMKRTKYTDAIKSSRKANMTPDKALEMQLSTIPGVTTKAARVVASKYPTMMDLCKAYEDTDQSLRANMLAELRVEGKNGKEQRLASRSAKIYSYVSGSDQ